MDSLNTTARKWRNLAPLMAPRRVAVVGASEKKGLGTRVLENLLQQKFKGGIYPINPNYPALCGVRCYPELAAVPEAPDCAVIASPIHTVPALLDAAADIGVPAVIVVAGGYGEAGGDGHARQEELKAQCDRRGLLLCGPNCMGIVNVRSGAVMFGVPMGGPILPGGVGLVCQSGGVTINTALSLMRTRGVGFSYFLSCGNQADISLEDYVHYMIEDEHTDLVVAFVEGFKRPGDLRELGEMARRRDKPIIVYKVGGSPVAMKMVQAHTGALAGARDVAAAALRQCGIVQVNSQNELVETISLLSTRAVRQRYRGGRRIAMLTFSGGACSIMADAGEDAGINFPELDPETQQNIGAALPGYGTPRNPVDGTDVLVTDPKLLPKLLGTLVTDAGLDMVMVHIGAQVPVGDSHSYWRSLAAATAKISRATDRPIVAFNPIIGGARDTELLVSLREAGVPFLDGTELSLAAISNLASYHEYRERLHDREREHAHGDRSGPHFPLGAEGGLLATRRAFDLLRSFDLPAVPMAFASDANAAAMAAARLGYPVALKVDSPDVPHKTEFGGVALALANESEVRAAFARITEAVSRRFPDAAIAGVVVQSMAAAGLEMILGVKRDREFGPAIVCGMGGIYAEVFDDVAIGLPPLSRVDTAAMLRRLKCWPLLDGARGLPQADVPALCDAIVNLSRLTMNLGRRIEAIDINPLVVHPRGKGVSALDVLVYLAGADRPA